MLEPAAAQQYAGPTGSAIANGPVVARMQQSGTRILSVAANAVADCAALHPDYVPSSLVTQFRTENRFALFLELLSFYDAIPDGKPLRTFPGIASRAQGVCERDETFAGATAAALRAAAGGALADNPYPDAIGGFTQEVLAQNTLTQELLVQKPFAL